MIIKPRRINRNTKQAEVKETNKPAEPQTPPIVGTGSPVRKNLESASQEDKKVNQNQPKPSRKKQHPKTTLEILMEDD